MSFEEENEVSQHLPASELKELTFPTKRSSSSKLGPELECAHSMGIPHTCTDGRCLPGAAPGRDCPEAASITRCLSEV